MLLGIACYAIVEFLAYVVYLVAVYEIAFVVTVHLLFQVGGMGVPAFNGFVGLFVFSFVAAQQEQVVNAQELKVEQHVFGFFSRKPAAKYVRHNGYSVALLYGGGHGHGSRTAAYVFGFEKAVAHVAVEDFAPVGGDIYVFRVELFELVDCICKAFKAVAFQRRQQFE